MSSADPLDFRIFDRLAEIMRAISTAAGYYYNVADAAVTLDGAAGIAEMPDPGVSPNVIIEPGTAESWEYQPAGQAVVTLTARITWIGSPRGPEDPGPLVALPKGHRQRTYWRAVRDITKAIADDYTLGGLVTDARVVGRQWNQDIEGADVYAIVDVQIRSPRDFTTPGGY